MRKILVLTAATAFGLILAGGAQAQIVGGVTGGAGGGLGGLGGQIGGAGSGALGTSVDSRFAGDRLNETTARAERLRERAEGRAERARARAAMTAARARTTAVEARDQTRGTAAGVVNGIRGAELSGTADGSTSVAGSRPRRGSARAGASSSGSASANRDGASVSAGAEAEASGSIRPQP